MGPQVIQKMDDLRSHLLVKSKKHIKKPPIYVLVETVGVEPTSGDIGTRASTSVVDILYFATSSTYRQASEALA